MKKLFISISIILFSYFAKAQFQDNKGFNFQGYARDAQGVGLRNRPVEIRYSLYPAGQPSSIHYTETHTRTTDLYGVFSAVVGSQSMTTFSKLPFSRTNYWLKVEVRTSGNWTTTTETELLSVPYARTAGNGNPVGTVIAFAGLLANIPQGYLLCEGQLLNKADYPELSSVLGNAWGGNVTQFNLPDMRGLFLRGVSSASARDDDRATRIAIASGGNTGNNVGTLQNDETRTHNHSGSGSTSTNGNHSHNYTTAQSWDRKSSGTGNGIAEYAGTYSTGAAGDHSHSFSFTTNATGGNETRPENVAVYYIIKF